MLDGTTAECISNVSDERPEFVAEDACAHRGSDGVAVDMAVDVAVSTAVDVAECRRRYTVLQLPQRLCVWVL